MAHIKCAGNPTFNEVNPGAISEWPETLPGLICKTPPFGTHSAARFAQCCSGPVYNITTPTTPDDPAYPVSCAIVCQIDPELDKPNYANPYHWSDHFMCLTDGDTERSGWDVVCATITVKGHPAPTAFSSTPSGWKMGTSSVETSEGPLETTGSTVTMSDGDLETGTRTRTGSATLADSTGSAGVASSTGGSAVSGTRTSGTAASASATSGEERMGVASISMVVLAVSVIRAGWGFL